MQLGDPPLFKILNQAMRDGDQKYLQSLGPYSVAMYNVLGASEKRERRGSSHYHYR